MVADATLHLGWCAGSIAGRDDCRGTGWGGCWDEVKGIILERLRHVLQKEIGRGECVQVGLTEVFTFWG